MFGDKDKICKKKKIAMSILFSGLYIAMRHIAKRQQHIETRDINKKNLYTFCHDDPNLYTNSIKVYECKIKPCFDRILSFGALVLLFPLFVIIALLIYIDDPGPVFFTQIRVGKEKKLFSLHKFRSMKMSTPHDVPTHQLENPEQYITKIGKILRKTSLDELPQIWDIFRGKMSIIGPRPALWNQKDLIVEREKYGANSVSPGLTGWAQINGRDELEIGEKARLDGEYVRILRSGNFSAIGQDIKCFLGTIYKVISHDGIVEGGTGELSKENRVSKKTSVYSWESENYGFLKTFHIDKSSSNKKNVLITGANSYIGESFKNWAGKYYIQNIAVDIIDMESPLWHKKNFAGYDCVLHVAGLVHNYVKKTDNAIKEKFYDVNTDLAIETCCKAKASNVKQFIFMSSMSIYGDSPSLGKNKVVDEHMMPCPDTIYGESKWRADKCIRKLEDIDFKVAVLRPPMIYGKGAKGNYSVLSKLARILPIFPNINNKRSMLYIDNLCEFLCLLVLSGENGIYFPQNITYTNTTDMVKKISEISGKHIHILKIINPFVAAGSWIPGRIGKLIDKAFGNYVYSQKLSRYEGMEYCVKTLEESIKDTEGLIK